MTLKNLRDGLNIFLRYAKHPSIYLGGAEHDVVYIANYDGLEEISEEDIRKLDELGFHKGDDGWEMFT